MQAEKITVAVRHGQERIDRPGTLVLPGLAITATLDRDDRRTLTHVPSGLAFMVGRCPTHMERAAELVRQLSGPCGVDWTVDEETLVGTPEAKEKLARIAEEIMGEVGRYCRERACGQDDAPSWLVRCRTCDWEWDDEYDEGPLTAAEARSMAQDHECEPDVQILPPDEGAAWLDPNLVNDDGSIHEPRAKEADRAR